MTPKFFNQDTNSRRELILKAPIISTILLLSIPTLMMGVVQAIVPIIDGLFINNLVGTLAAGAITYCSPIINTMMALSSGLSVAGMALIGQTYGKGEFKKAKDISTQLIALAAITGILIAPIIALLSIPVSNHVTPQLSHNVFIYMSLNALVIPFSFIEAIYNAIKNASGKPEATFIRMLLLLILKLIFNFLFIYLLKLGIVGSVLSSLTANILITVWMFYELFVQESEDKLTFKNFKFDIVTIKSLVHIGIPSMLSNVLMSLGFVLINNEVQKYGAVALTGQGISNSIGSLCFILPSCFSSAVTTTVSMNIGADNPDRAKDCCSKASILSFITAALLILLIVPLSKYLTISFTRNRDVLYIANKSLHIFIYSGISFGIISVQQGAFIGLGYTKITLFINLLRIWFLRYVFILLTEKYLGVYSVFWGNLFSNYTVLFISTFIFMKLKWVSRISYNTK